MLLCFTDWFTCVLSSRDVWDPSSRRCHLDSYRSLQLAFPNILAPLIQAQSTEKSIGVLLDFLTFVIIIVGALLRTQIDLTKFRLGL